MRKTKIICTIGPASASEEVLTAMCQAGMNIARINFSHGTHPEHLEKIETIRRVREKLNLPIAIMLDTKGPEYRIKTFAAGKVRLKKGEPFTLRVDDVPGDARQVSVNYAGLAEDLKPGDRVLLANGLLALDVERIEGTQIHCVVAVGGGTPELGTALLIGALVETPMMFLFSRVERRLGVGRVLKVSVLLMALKPWFILLFGSVWGVYLMRASHFFSFAPFLLALTYYGNERMAEDEKVTVQALITGAISLSGVFSYLFGGMLVSACGALRALLLCTLIGMAGGALFLFFAVRDQKRAHGA